MPLAVPDAVRLTARPGEHAEDVLARCPPNTAAFAFHINGTFIGEFPHARHALIATLESRGIAPINAAIVDISKRWVQQVCASCGLPVATATADGDPDERVIVKTNHNFGGRSERQFTAEQLVALKIPRPSPTVLSATTYPVLMRREVPVEWWTDSTLAIERYIENRWNRIYRVSCAGRRFDLLRMVNPGVLKKVDGATEQAVIYCTRDQLERGAAKGVEAEVMLCIARFVDAAKLDFGGLDIMMDDEGRAFVLDVNVTPYGLLNSLRRLLSIRRGLFELVVDRAPHVSRSRLGVARGSWPPTPMLIGALAKLTRTPGH